MAQTNLEVLKKSFIDLRKYIQQTNEEIAYFRKLKVFLFGLEINEKSVEMSEQLYNKFYSLYSSLNRDYELRKKIELDCGDVQTKKELRFQLSEIQPFICKIANCLEDLLNSHINVFQEFLKSSGKEYAENYLKRNKK